MEGKTRYISGNVAAALGAKLARIQVAPIYPITPATTVSEKISDLIDSNELQAKIIYVESEHSAMAACIGAAMTGVRAFTATSSQGLLLMNEMIHWAAGARLPIVMAVANRAICAPWALWADHNDTMSVKDTGWIQLYCTNAQEVLDTILLAYRISEQTLIPVMVIYEGFLVSHTYEPVIVPSQKDADKFLPPLKPKFKLDPKNPISFGTIIMMPDYAAQLRYRQNNDMLTVFQKSEEAAQEFESAFGRSSTAIVESHNTKTAQTIFISMGTMADTAKEVEKNPDIGWIRIKMFRPFPSRQIQKIILDRVWDDFSLKRIIVLDRNLSCGQGGHLWQEIRSALYDVTWRCNPYCDKPKIFGYVAGLNGDDITPETIEEIIKHSQLALNDERPILWGKGGNIA